MSARLKYFLHRAREAGLRPLVRKLGQKLRPYAYWPLYATGGGRSITGAPERAALRAFGTLCESAFRTLAAADSQGYTARARARLLSAESTQWQVLGYGPLAKPTGTGWHCDPLHGHDFIPRYFPNCDFLAAQSHCDVKIPWEFSRLQWLLWEAEAIATGSSERVERATAALKTVMDWETANPPGYGVNWTCGMEVAIRGANLAVICSVLSLNLDDATTDKLAALLRAHQRFLARFPEVSDVPGNHYLTDLMGEVVLHAALDGLGSPATARALAQFAGEAEAQFEPGGCHLERATIYHRLTLDVVALPYALALRAGDAATPALGRVMKRAASFIAQIADDGGRLPVFGDQDSGFVLWFGEAAQQSDARICAAPLAPLTDQYGFLAGLAGETGTFFPAITRKDGDRSGFATMSGCGFRATLKTGPIGLKGRAAHDHDDALSVAVSYGPHAVLVDPGCHSYTLDPAIRFETIVSSRHNAPAPATRERHAPTMGSINATVRGAPTAVLATQEVTALIGEVARTPTSRMSFTRTLRLEGGALEIADDWQFDTPEGARLLWLFDPAWTIEGPEDAAIPPEGLVLRLHRGATTLIARLVTSNGARLTRHTDRYSPDYGAWADCPALNLTTAPAEKGHARLILSGPPDVPG